MLLTRLAIDPLNGGGMPPVPRLVRWGVAKDPAMRRIVKHGVATAWPSLTGTRNIGPIRTCRRPTPRFRSSSCPTTTKWRTTMRAGSQRTTMIPRSSWPGGRTRTAPTTSTCRSGGVLPVGARIRLARGLTWDTLVSFSALDTRQYRSDQPCGDGLAPRCAEALAETQTMTGAAQEQWLLRWLDSSHARWNVIAQQTTFAQFDFNADPRPGAELFIMDQWDGYVAARRRITDFLLERRPSNPIVITGDIHSSWVHNLKADFDDPASATVGAEYIGSSISSDFPAAFVPPVQAAVADNPHTLHFDGFFRGHARCQVSRTLWRTDFRAVLTILDENVDAFTLASFVSIDGVPGAMAG